MVDFVVVSFDHDRLSVRPLYDRNHAPNQSTDLVPKVTFHFFVF
jgi:hypothetical protein